MVTKRIQRKVTIQLAITVELMVPIGWDDARAKDTVINEIKWMAESAPKGGDLHYQSITMKE